MRKVTVIFASLQKREVLEGNFETLNDVIEALEDKGYTNITNSNYVERYTRNRYRSNDTLPETVVDRNGNTTTDLIFSVSNNEKFENGTLTRAEIYKLIKDNNLQEEIKNKMGKNFTLVSTNELLTFIPQSVTTTPNKNSTTLEERVVNLEVRVATLEEKLEDLEFAIFPEN